MTVNLQSREYGNKLLNDLREADSKAKDAHEKGQAAFAEAQRQEQAVTQLDMQEEKLRVEWDQLQRSREEARQKAQEARAFGERQHAARDEYAAQATDARTFLELAGITVDPNLLVPTSAPNGQVPPTAPMVELDPTEAARIDQAIGRMVAAEQTELTDKQREGKAL